MNLSMFNCPVANIFFVNHTDGTEILQGSLDLNKASTNSCVNFHRNLNTLTFDYVGPDNKFQDDNEEVSRGHL